MVKMLSREEIEDKKWNGCVHFGHNGLPYGYTWYLDNLVEHWMGLVWKDYEAVMPIVYNVKWGMKYMYQPMFCQQLGIFSLSPLSHSLQRQFFEAIPSDIRFADYCLNEGHTMSPDSALSYERKNQIIYLDESYEEIFARYHSTNRRHIKKAKKQSWYLDMGIKPEEYADMVERNLGIKIPGFQAQHKHALLRLSYHARSYQVGIISGIRNEEHELMTCGFFIFNPMRMSVVQQVVEERFLKQRVGAYLMDRMIEWCIGKKKIFDFAGSELPGVRQFNERMGAESVPYTRVFKNDLPWPIKYLKRP